MLTPLLLTGCSSLRVKLDLRTSLPKIPVASIEATLPGLPAMAPGEKRGLIVAVTEPDGTILLTEGQGRGRVLWKDLAIATTVVSVRKGMVSLPYDPRVSDGKVGHLVVTVPSHPGLRTSLDIPLRYDWPFTASFVGLGGSSGSNGNNGLDGSSGTPGSFDPDHPSAGGNGGNGTAGTDGSDGTTGSPGPRVTVRATLRQGAHPLLQMVVMAANEKDRFYLVDPQGGSLSISSTGGASGSGGTGGRGGNGGLGGSGSPPGLNGSAGSNGRDGSNGQNGSPVTSASSTIPRSHPTLASSTLEGAEV